MEQSIGELHVGQSPIVRYCDRCARRASKLLCDDLTWQELCQECWEQLKRKRELASSLAILKK
ncbi:hypothetical protein [Candidatus Nitrospira nitrosa]|uniref:hypothetical protein n=1 Tax=Candidatus Nitrospira nitrosa TaxID=1742972 RepID=UPI000A6151F1|nr:hypothetical protein [Candidatus Nitrospira nitrosa]